MIGALIDGATMAAAMALLAALIRQRASAAACAAMLRDVRKTRLAAARARLAARRGDPMARAAEARPPAWLDQEALDAAALGDVHLALRRLLPITGEKPDPATCAAMVMLIAGVEGKPIVGDGEMFDIAARAAATARRAEAAKRGRAP